MLKRPDEMSKRPIPISFFFFFLMGIGHLLQEIFI